MAHQALTQLRDGDCLVLARVRLDSIIDLLQEVVDLIRLGLYFNHSSLKRMLHLLSFLHPPNAPCDSDPLTMLKPS